ncbi:Homeodomain-like protein [Kockiozyma suomiensis]|uniref:Homeodomain-like protein n=1 Tax=Kockiozyma suomiensis TaxID=1337062 RepID=UPI0033432779
MYPQPPANAHQQPQSQPPPPQQQQLPVSPYYYAYTSGPSPLLPGYAHTVSNILTSAQDVKPKRKRATPFQATRLEEILQQTHFPSTEQRLELARELGMTPRTVQIWFQNRRQAHRAENKRRSTGINDSIDGRSGDDDDFSADGA